MEDTPSIPANSTEVFITSLADKGVLSQALTDIGLSELVVDWLNKEVGVRPVFGRLVVKMLMMLADKTTKTTGKSLLKILKLFPFYQQVERRLTDLLAYMDKELRATKEFIEFIKGERSAAISPELAKNLSLDLQGQLKLIRDVETLSEKFGNVMTEDQLAELSQNIESSLSKIPGFLNPQPVLQINAFKESDERYRFLYGAQRSKFVGRAEELRELQNFLTDKGSFYWWIMTGEAGLGKSRLALELCLRSGWRAGFLPFSFTRDEYSNWVPSNRTLIVVDYTAFRAKDIGEIVRILKTHADNDRFPFPVRLLLLERSKKRYYENESYYADVREEQWFQTFLGVFGAEQQLTHSAWYAKGKTPMTLGPLPPDQTWTIITAFGKGKVREEKREEILKVLKEKIDPLSRPLYAAMLGDAIGAGRNYRKLGTLDVLKDLLQREEKRFWKPAWEEDEIPKKDQERDKDVLALATMAGEIDADSVFLPTELEDMLNSENFSFERYALMSAGSTDRLLKPLAPDIFGEAFVLEHLMPTKPRQPKKCDQLRDIAWSLSTENMDSFLSRISDDFPDHPTLKCLR